VKAKVALPHRTGAHTRENRAALGRGISEGARLNDNQIVASRGARAHPPNELSLADFQTNPAATLPRNPNTAGGLVRKTRPEALYTPS
jgi:hypothetical protein